MLDSLELPSLNKVDGSFTIESPEGISGICDHFGSLARSGNAVDGTFTCNDVVVQPSSSSQSEGASSANPAAGSSTQPESQSDSTSSGSSSLSAGAKAGVGVGAGVGGALLIAAAIAVVVLKRRRKDRLVTGQPENVGAGEKDARIMLGNDTQRHELEHPAVQLPEGREAQELPAKHGQGELGRSTSGKPLGVESRHELPANER